jgi:hypothetical protein
MLPPYVYDLIAAVQKWEDEHGDKSMCFDHVLDSIPQQERDRAAAIAHYQRERLRLERGLEGDAAIPSVASCWPLGSPEDEAVRAQYGIRSGTEILNSRRKTEAS